MESRRIDLFHLTDLEIFKSLRQGLFSADLPAQLRDLILSIHEVTTPKSPNRHVALELLVYADIEFSVFKSSETMARVNEALAAAVNRAHDYVLMKLNEVSSSIGYVATEGEPEIQSDIQWNNSKAALVYLCHAIKVGGCVMPKNKFSQLLRTLSSAFNIEISEAYAQNLITGLRSKSSDKSVTKFFDFLGKSVIEDINRRIS